MQNILDTIPVFDERRLSYSKEKNDEVLLKIKKYERFSHFKINKQTSYILSKCNGENSLKDIIGCLKNKYSDIDEDTIRVDLLSVLESLWKFEVINWKTRHPFVSSYEMKKDDYKLEMLTTESINQIFKYINNNSIDDPYYDAKYMKKLNNIKDFLLVGINSYYVVRKGEDIKLIYKMMNYSKPSKNSLLLHPIYLDGCDEICSQFLLECIQWSKSRQETLLNRKLNNKIYCYVNEDLESKYRVDYFENIGFKNIGKITKEQANECTYFKVLALEI